MNLFEELEPKEWLELNAKLQQKKNKLRAELHKKGILKKGARNDYDNYKYFSEAQYKELFTELFSQNKLELKYTELEYTTFEGTEKQANGRMPKLQFSLIDTDTGFYEDTVTTGEGIDKGDKAGYKAYTGALKYYLANTFMVATGDDPENESPDNKMNTKIDSKVTDIEAKTIYSMMVKKGWNVVELLEKNYGIKNTSELTKEQYASILKAINDNKDN